MAEIKVSIMTRHEQWRANPFSVRPHPVPQPLVAHRSINSDGTNAPTSPSTPSSSRSHPSIPRRSDTPSPYEQSPSDDDRAEHVDTLLREEVHPAHGTCTDQWNARESDTLRCRVAEQHRQEVDGILRRQREAEHAAQAARLGQPTGQNQGVIASVTPVSSVQYPSLESPTRCVILFGDCASFSGT
jgi:hypothetical protein